MKLKSPLNKHVSNICEICLPTYMLFKPSADSKINDWWEIGYLYNLKYFLTKHLLIMKGEILTLNREDSQIPFSHVIKVNITNNKTYCPNLFQYMMYREDIWRRHWRPTPVLLPGKSHTWRSLVGCSPWGCEESDTTERLHFHFSLSCIGEGNGNPLHCSCLENPRDGGAWWAAISGVAQSRTWLKWLSSSSKPFYSLGGWRQ